MNKIFFIACMTIPFISSYGQSITPPKTVLTFEQEIIFPAQEFNARIYILNKLDSLDYNVIYFPLGSNRPRIDTANYDSDADCYVIRTFATYGRTLENENFARRTLKYSVLVSGRTIDTTFDFNSEVKIHLPIMNFQTNDTIRVYANEKSTIKANYPLNYSYFLDRETKLTFTKSTSNGADVITSDMKEITFIAKGNLEFLELISNCGGNIAGKIIIQVIPTDTKRKKKTKR